MAVRAKPVPAPDDPLRAASPAVDDVEARRARAAIESRLFSGPAKRIKVGRYRVEGKIGAGGMGVVYRAHDPELARDVALKVLNTDSVPDREAGRARGRLVREARAMAKLAHPNVIHVYDVGAVDDGVFIAMELVDGDALSVWLDRERPSWRDTLRCFLDAGEGLAAAHEAGIVHRDFKPENVLLGSDGRVRVGDFGLAGGTGSETGRHEPVEPDPSESGRAEVDKEAVSTSLTRTGALLGTPKYMAPEQEMGLGATPRSDQFGFCVALYEGLYGRPPFAGETVMDYRRQVTAEAVREPKHGDVPAWVFDVLRTGLRRDPLARHRDMPALLEALRGALADPLAGTGKRRTAFWIGVLGAGVGLAIGAAVALQRPPSSDETPVLASLDQDGLTDAQAVPRVETAGDAVPIDTAPSDTAWTATDAATPDPPGADPEPRAEPALPPDEVIAVTSTPQVSPPDEDPKATPIKDRKRKRSRACYYMEDKRSFIQASKRRVEAFEHAGTCYSCRKAGSHVVTTLSPPEGNFSCRTSHLCTADPTACE